jgi:hypothetical protein
MYILPLTIAMITIASVSCENIEADIEIHVPIMPSEPVVEPPVYEEPYPFVEPTIVPEYTEEQYVDIEK